MSEHLWKLWSCTWSSYDARAWSHTNYEGKRLATTDIQQGRCMQPSRSLHSKNLFIVSSCIFTSASNNDDRCEAYQSVR